MDTNEIVKIFEQELKNGVSPEDLATFMNTALKNYTQEEQKRKAEAEEKRKAQELAVIKEQKAKTVAEAIKDYINTAYPDMDNDIKVELDDIDLEEVGKQLQSAFDGYMNLYAKLKKFKASDAWKNLDRFFSDNTNNFHKTVEDTSQPEDIISDFIKRMKW